MESGQGKHRGRTVAIVIVVAAITLIATYAATTQFFAQTYKVPGEGMAPAIGPGERIVVDKIVYRFRQPRPGEVIVFNAPPDWTLNRPSADYDLVKRVIAVGGQTVQCREDTGLTLDGKTLAEPYLDEKVMGPAIDRCWGFQFGPVTVPEGRLWVMGDNRTHSADSRAHCTWPPTDDGIQCTSDATKATIPVANAVGRVSYIYNAPLGFRNVSP